MLHDTICGISTSLNNGAISIVRISGENAFSIIKKLAKLKDEQIIANTIKYGHIYDEDEIIDEVMISFFKAPFSYTKEDIVEINCHGGIYITKKILELILSKGARLSENGEFTKRAYLNGRIDLTKAESINDMINAKNKLQSNAAIKGINGEISKIINPFKEELQTLILKLEVNIDYPEYQDEEEIVNQNIKENIHNWLNKYNDLIDKSRRFNTLKNGIKTVIVGKPNVGKSSLLNALINQDKAIVTEIAGTTRDIVEGEVNIGNVILNLIDTAGIRETEDIIENIGINKSKQYINESDLIIVLYDNNHTKEDEEILNYCQGKNYIEVYNKKDIGNKGNICISALNKDIQELIDEINKMYETDLSLINEELLNNERQISLIQRALDELKTLYEIIDDITLDIAIINLTTAYDYLCQIIGIEYKEDLIDNMFRKFCLGK